MTFVNIILQKTQDIKTIPLPNVAIPLVNLMLRTSLLCQIWGSPLDYLIQMRQIVSIQNSIFKSIRKLIFSAFGTILVLVAPFFHSKLNLENIKILIFPSFWHDIGFGGSLFLFKIQCKKSSKFCFFPAFGTILVLHFFLQKKRRNAKTYKKDTSSKRSHTLGEPYT